MKGTIIEETTYRIVTAGMALAWLMVLGGCASGEISDGEECSVEDDCPSEMSCVDGICTPSDAQPTADAGDGERDVRPPEDGVVDPEDGGDVQNDVTDEDAEPQLDGGDIEVDGGGDVDTGPSGCTEDCGVGEICEEGECVSRCRQPSCASDQQCADLGDGPRCYETCSSPGSPDGCGDGEFCRDLLTGEDDELPVCMPSQCSNNGECDPSGTCLQFINDFGRCVTSGPKAVGESCDLATRSERCEEGAYCVRESSQDTTGTCRKLCDPWADSNRCGSDAYCGVFKQRSGGLSLISTRQGYCNPSVESERKEPFELCDTDGNMCNDAVRCLGSDNPYCVKWCRPGTRDCTGAAPDSVPRRAVCNNYVFGGIREIGSCEIACESDSDCRDDEECDGQDRCRQTCSSASDCCDGATSCPFECNNGLCE